MKTYRIFLASSSELKADRLAFETFISRENKRLTDKNVFLHLEIWEDAGDAMSRTRSQDEYSRLLIECDLFVMLYWTKVGKYSNEEYDLARAQFLSTHKPKKIYTYRKTIPPIVPPSQADTDSLQAFEEKLSRMELFPINYDSAEALQLDFGTKLKDLFADGTLVYGGMAKCLSAGQPAVPEGFIGRDDELRTIRQRMNEGGTLMLINSEGGMGKTSLAAKYWKENLYQYTHNAWLFCQNGIVEEMKQLAPPLNLDLAQLPESQHIMALRTALQNLPANCLLVLDNANNADDIRAFQQAFSGLHWHILLTSRCQHVLADQQELPITHLPPPLAKKLFTSYYDEQTPEFDHLLDRLLQAIGYNTLLIELFAKNMAELAALNETLADFLKRFETEGLLLKERSFEVKTTYKIATTDAIIEALYDLTNLEKAEPERFRLVNMALLPAENHPLPVLIDLFAPDDKITLRNQLANLAQKGWLTTDTKSYRLSPVIQKILLAKYRDRLWDDGKKLVDRLTNLLKLEQDKDNIITKFQWLVYALPLQTYFAESNDSTFANFQNNLALVLQDVRRGGPICVQAKALLEQALTQWHCQLWRTGPGGGHPSVKLSHGLTGVGRGGQPASGQSPPRAGTGQWHCQLWRTGPGGGHPSVELSHGLTGVGRGGQPASGQSPAGAGPGQWHCQLWRTGPGGGHPSVKLSHGLTGVGRGGQPASGQSPPRAGTGQWHCQLWRTGPGGGHQSVKLSHGLTGVGRGGPTCVRPKSSSSRHWSMTLPTLANRPRRWPPVSQT